ncbi:MAG: S-adenosylmethionine:tRNA ribosyltransferase-isomerase, partial [Candidatus Magnetoglobus multicellularis str. Araruama]
MSFHIKDYDYNLPDERIAQSPADQRDRSRLLVYDRKSRTIKHTYFTNLTNCLNSGDVLVINNTRVIPARLLGKKQTGGKIEVFILDYQKAVIQDGFTQCECMIRSSKPPKTGTRIYFSNKEEAVVLTMPKNGQCIIQFNCDDLLSFLNQVGQTPLPPYIQRVADKKDQDRYQTIYAKNNGAIAAPTAGLHFTPQLIETIKQMGIQMVPITLHVGYGTFMPVRVQDIRKHFMHKEYIEISQDSATKIYQAKQNKQRIVAVGTTSVRALEYVYQRQETFG